MSKKDIANKSFGIFNIPVAERAIRANDDVFSNCIEEADKVRKSCLMESVKHPLYEGGVVR